MATHLTASHWLVAVPNELGSAKATADRFASAVSAKGSGAEVSVWEVPPMKVGTLDSLMSLADELGKADSYVEGVTRKAERSLADAYAASEAGAPALRVGNLPVADAAKRFSWDREQFDPQEPLPELARRLVAGAEKVDADLRSVVQGYGEKRTALTALERKRGGNLMVCGLEEVVTAAALDAAGAELAPADSEYLASLLLVLPKSAEEGFLGYYETQLDGAAVPLGGEGAREAVRGSPVVPRSARRVAEDKDGYVLYALTILKRFEGSFRAACKEKRLTVRDFNFDPAAAGSAAAAAAALDVDVGASLTALKETAARKYAEAASLWMHLKAVRLFVEAVLRFGLPVNFVALLIRLSSGGQPRAQGGAAAPGSSSSSGGGGGGAQAARKVMDGVQAAWRSASGAAGGLLDAQYGDAPSSSSSAKKKGANDAMPAIAGITDGTGGASFPFVFDVMDLKA